MAQYIVNSENQETETLLIAYRDARGGIQSQAGQMYHAILRTETAYAEFDVALQIGGSLESLGAYHVAKQAAVSDAVVTLRTNIAGVMALMVQMQAGYAAATGGAGILFPGVPTE